MCAFQRCCSAASSPGYRISWPTTWQPSFRPAALLGTGIRSVAIRAGILAVWWAVWMAPSLTSQRSMRTPSCSEATFSVCSPLRRSWCPTSPATTSRTLLGVRLETTSCAVLHSSWWSPWMAHRYLSLVKLIPTTGAPTGLRCGQQTVVGVRSMRRSYRTHRSQHHAQFTAPATSAPTCTCSRGTFSCMAPTCCGGCRRFTTTPLSGRWSVRNFRSPISMTWWRTTQRT
mmetsp:Transcript_48006/g.120806  ORF Transcript_48006/g.120806 Transcript_48006/m.120806 type:complete len:229 (+) Transcript_48006:210-896(+)